MSVIDGIPLLLGGEGYDISRSVRLRSSASAYFNRTPGSASNRRTWTWSGWVKRGALGGNNAGLLTALDSAGVRSGIMYESNNQLIVYNNNTTSARYQLAQIHRDPSAWYHIVVAYDTTQATSSDRIKVWVNSVLNSATSGTLTYPSQNYDGSINNTVAHNIGRDVLDNTYLDGYLTEINFIDGQALTPSSFGETDAATGVWKPKKYAGTYGTNGFFLNFSDNSSNTATTIGKDYSGNGNNWTPNNISVTAGSTYDSMLDVPTLWADGGNGRGNYCVWNPLSKMGTPTNSAANLQTSLATSSLVNGSMTVSSGKWYYETQFTSGADAFMGWNRVDLQTGTGNAFQQAGSLLYFSSNGNRYKDGDGGAAYGASYTTSDAIGCAIDLDSNQVTWYKNNVAQSTISITAGNYAPCLATGGTACSFLSNFGQRPFTYTPPTGFKALNTQNLPEPTIKKGASYFDISTWTGDQSARTITNSGGMQPDFLWTKSRSAAEDHRLSDSVRGGNGTVLGTLASNTTGAEAFDTDVTGFTSSGFNIRAGTNSPNVTGRTYVGWQWQAGKGVTSSNTNGTITSTTSVSTTAGFSIVRYTGNGTNGATIGHGLGVAPAMTIVKDRSNGTNGWPVWQRSFAGTQTLYLESTTGLLTRDRVTAVSSTTFTVSSHTEVNNSGNSYIAYVFAAVAGYSAFGSYTGNGSADGPFIYTGFRPRFLLVKRTDTVESWNIIDTARDATNQAGLNLYPNLSNAESSNNTCDILSNGVKLRNTWAGANANGGTYIYAAFAETAFRYSLAR